MPLRHSNAIHNWWKLGAAEVPTDRWMGNNMQSVYIMEYYSSLKRKGIQTPAITWMNLEYTMLSAISRSQKTHTVHFTYRGLGVIRIWGRHSRTVVAGAGRRWRLWSHSWIGTVSGWQDEAFWRWMDGGNGYRATWMYLMALNCTLYD